MTLTLEKTQAKPREAKAPPFDAPDTEYHWTVAAFYRAINAGVFEQPERLELIQGRIIENMSQGPRHSTLASIVADMLRDALRRQFAVREEKPIRIDFDGEPIPNILLLKGRQTDYEDQQPVPEDVALLVEVSDTTVLYDLGGKALLYAQAGIRDYWVVLVNEGAIVQHREPTPDGYQSAVRLSGSDAISPLAAPETVWTTEVLLGREDAARED